MNYRQLRDKLMVLTDFQLDCEVIWMGDERGGKVGHLDTFIDDQVNDDDYYIEDHSGFCDGRDLIEDKPCDHEIVYRKGHPVLIVDC